MPGSAPETGGGIVSRQGRSASLRGRRGLGSGRRHRLCLRRLGFLALALVAVSCTTAGSRRAETAIRQATARYAGLVAAMDHAAIAAMFTADGEIAVEGQQPIRGREQIERHLESFRQFHVLSEALTADRVTAHGAAAESAGTYRQKVRLPDGNVVEVHGAYTAEWRRAPSGAWEIAAMTTVPQP